LLEAMGSNLKLARLRRKFSAETVAQRAGISRKTMYRVEQGDPAVSLGIYARVMQALGLGLEQDLSLLAADDLLGRKLQDAGLTVAKRAPKRAANAPLRADARLRETISTTDCGQLIAERAGITLAHLAV
jgi:transcriptional regulator with XRE-family HTH domain